MSFPTRIGFYWAKWLTADRATSDGSLLTPNDEWDVVCVVENDLDGQPTNRFRVLVPGVEAVQAVGDFEWGPGPLSPPD